jgi:hypothetical protein
LRLHFNFVSFHKDKDGANSLVANYAMVACNLSTGQRRELNLNRIIGNILQKTKLGDISPLFRPVLRIYINQHEAFIEHKASDEGHNPTRLEKNSGSATGEFSLNVSLNIY